MIVTCIGLCFVRTNQLCRTCVHVDARSAADRSFSHSFASVIKQYNLVPAKAEGR